MLHHHPTSHHPPVCLISCVLYNILSNKPLCPPELCELLEPRWKSSDVWMFGSEAWIHNKLGLETGSENWARVEPSAYGIGCSLQVNSVRTQLASSKLVSMCYNWLLLARDSLISFRVSAPVL